MTPTSEPVPLRRKVMWSPITALVCLVAQLVADLIVGFTPARIAGLGVTTLWLGLAIYNLRVGGAFVRGLYGEDEARVVEPDERDKR